MYCLQILSARVPSVSVFASSVLFIKYRKCFSVREHWNIKNKPDTQNSLEM